MTRWITALAVVCFSVAGATQAPPRPPSTPPQTEKAQPTHPTMPNAAADADFMRDAAMSSLAEVEHGRLAATNAASDDVKQFGHRMVTDHSKASDELKGLAAPKTATLPSTLDQKHQAMQDKLSKMKGAEFDRASMSHMVSAHRQAITLFEQESKSGKDSDVKAWAEKTLPTVREHHKIATEVNAKLGKT